MAKSPPIAHSDALGRWHQAMHYEWEDSAEICGVCPAVFRTGDIVFVWGAMDGTAIARRAYTCVRCGMVALAEGGLRPSGALVYVQRRHREVELDELPGEIQLRIYEGFRLLDDLASGVRAAAGSGS